MSDSDTDSQGSWTVIWVTLICVFSLLFFYVASPGICIIVWGGVSDTLMLLYAPLEWLYEYSDTYESFIDWCWVIRDK